MDAPEIKIGTRVWIDGWRLPQPLLPSDWEAAPFRIESFNYVGTTRAVKVEITGRTRQWKSGEPWMRAKVTFVGDGEPDVELRGWVRS